MIVASLCFISAALGMALGIFVMEQTFAKRFDDRFDIWDDDDE